MSPLSTKSFFETVPIDPFKVRSLVLVGIVQMSHVLTFVFFYVLQGYKEKFDARLTAIREEMNAQIQNEERWTRSWQRSITKIKELY